MNSKALYVSGISGFVGSNLKQYLGQEYIINGLSRTSETLDYLNFTSKDIEEAKAFIHLAGKAHDLKNTSNCNAYFEVNTELTKQFYNKFLQSNCEIFIYMSSVKALADQVEGTLTEEVVGNPKTAYGKSKLEAEKYILQNLPQNTNQKVFILRPCMIHGPGNKGNLNLLYAFVKKGIPFPLGAYKNQRSFLSVDNLSFVIAEILNGTIGQGVYNVSDLGTLSINQLVETIGKADNKKVKVLNVPKWIIKLIAKTGDVIPLVPLNSEKLQKLTEDYIVDNSKLLKALKKPLPININEGIIKTITHFK